MLLALAGEFVPFAVNVARGRGARDRAAVPAARRAARPAVRRRSPRACLDALEVEYEGEIADYDSRILTLSVLKGVFGPVDDEPVSFVNAPQLAEERGVEVREIDVGHVGDYVNLITRRAAAATSLAGTLVGQRGEPRIVMIDDHTVDVPPASHMLVVRNDDRPGMIGIVGTVLGDAGVNIADMDVGRSQRRGRRSWCSPRPRPCRPT